MKADVSVSIYPTEDKHSILKGLSNLFGIANPSEVVSQDILEFTNDLEETALDMLRKRVFELRIIDVVRSELRHRWDGSHSSLTLNKQAALRGIISLIDSSMGQVPLGGIDIRFSFEGEEEFEEFLSWFAPQTKDGRVVQD